MNKFDFKKEYKDLYMPKTKPMIIDVPKMTFIMVDGKGNPNTCSEYKEAMEILYGLSYSIKMSKMSGTEPEGYFEYVVPPLEGFWWTKENDFDGVSVKNKDEFIWTSFIRQPDFVTEEVFQRAKEVLKKKKPELDLNKARLENYTEGKCAQVMHIGPFDSEPESIKKLNEFIKDSGYITDIGDRKHHEIYLGDPRRTSPDKLKTVIRHPVRKCGNETL